MNRGKSSIKSETVIKVIGWLLTFCAIIIITAAIIRVAGDSGDESLKRLETSIRRSVMACYSDEGVYPPDIEYLERHYGLQFDRDRFIVHYSVFAENIMPEITVLERKA